MATVTERRWQIQHDDADGTPKFAWIEIDYDDVTRMTSAYRWRNDTEAVVLAFIVLNHGTVAGQTVLNTRADPHTSGSGNITGPRRWNVDLDPWPNVNLAT